MKAVTFPQISETYYEKMQKTAIGKQKYWYDLLIKDVAEGSRILSNILRFPETLEQLISDKIAIELILDGKADVDDRDETIIGTLKTGVNWTLYYTVPENKVLIVTEHQIYNGNSYSTNYGRRFQSGGSYFGETTSNNIGAFQTVITPMNVYLKEGESIYFNCSAYSVTNTFKGILIDLSLVDVFLKNKYGVGKGLTTKLGVSLPNLSSKDSLNDIVSSIPAMNDMCSNADALDLIDSIGRDNFLTNGMTVAKWIASKGGYNPSDYDNIGSIYGILNNLLSSPSMLIRCKQYIYSNKDYINEILTSSDFNELSVMKSGHMLLGYPWKVAKNNNQTDAQTQYNSYYQLRMNGATTSTGYVTFNSNETFDLTNVDTVEFDFDTSNHNLTPILYLGVFNGSISANGSTSACFSDSSPDYNDPRKTVSVNVSSLVGEYYLKIAMYDDSGSDDADLTIDLYNIKFKKNA